MLNKLAHNAHLPRTLLFTIIILSLTGCDLFEFEKLSLPNTAEERATIRTTDKVTMRRWLSEEFYPIGYMPLYTSGQQMDLLGGSGTITWGAWYDRNLENLLLSDGSLRLSNALNGPDFTSLLTHDGELFAVTQLESAIGGAYITKLSQEPATGKLSAVATRPVDTSDVFGLYANGSGQVTPWGTHLGSEQHEPSMHTLNANATAYRANPAWVRTQNNMRWFADESWHDEHMLAIAEFNGLDNSQLGERDAEGIGVGPETFGYYYGWIPEIAITSTEGDHAVKKHYAMGRFSHEQAYVMPDEKTVYLSDDGDNTGFFMFVADNPRDLSAGNLYAAKWNQVSSAGLGSANLTWISLGHASNDQIKSALVESSGTDEGIRFEDMFGKKDRPNTGGVCPTSGFTSVNAYDHALVCVRLQEGQYDTDGDGAGDVNIATLASRLETRLYAGMQGATTEFRKGEGITFNPDRNHISKMTGQHEQALYVAMSQIARGMENYAAIELNGSNLYDKGGNNDIRLDGANLCGGVYALDIARSPVTDTQGVVINSEYVVKNMYGLLAGSHVTGSQITSVVCDADNIANPDNLTYLEGYGELVIGEDTDAVNHENNMVWSYDVVLGKLVRIATTPDGAEATGPFWHPNINGWGYLSLVAQHPRNQNSSVGVIGPFPALD